MKRIGLVVVGMLCASVAFGDLAEYVDPFTGTAGTGHTHPAACVPFGMFPVEPSVFVREIPSELVVTKRVMDFPDAYGGGYGAYGSRGGYAGGYGGYRKPVKKSIITTSWRR